MDKFSLKKLLGTKKERRAVDLLNKRQDMTFKEISIETGVKLRKIYEFNGTLESKRKTQEMRQFENEKAGRRRRQSEEHSQRLHEWELRQTEQLYFDFGMTISEVAEELGIKYYSASLLVKEVKERRNQKGDQIVEL